VAGGAAILREHDVAESAHFLSLLLAIARTPSSAGAPLKAPAR
jgi:dihydropteroate synthase